MKCVIVYRKSKANSFTTSFRMSSNMLSLEVPHYIILSWVCGPGESFFIWTCLFSSISCQNCPKGLEHLKWALDNAACWHGCNSDYGNKWKLILQLSGRSFYLFLGSFVFPKGYALGAKIPAFWRHHESEETTTILMNCLFSKGEQILEFDFNEHP